MKTDALMLSLSRSLRSFVFTLLAFSSPFFLISQGIGYFQIGIVLLLSSISSAALIYTLPVIRVSVSIKVFLSWAIFFTGTAVIALTDNLAGYLVAVIVCGISLSGKDMSPNQPMEQYAISTFSASRKEKYHQFSYYNLLSYAGNTLGALSVLIYPGISFASIFYICAILSFASGIPYLLVEFPAQKIPAKGRIVLGRNSKTLRNQLGALFGVDAFAGGLISTSLLSLWFVAVFSASLSQTGFIFAVVNILTGLSVIISGRMSVRYGVIRTMVYTHLASNFFLILMSFSRILLLGELFLFLRQATSQMDVTPRDSLINTIFESESRLKTNSQFLTIRNLSSVPSPALGGLIIGSIPEPLPAIAGAIKAAYDIVLYVRFRHIGI
jgi:MFS family permease